MGQKAQPKGHDTGIVRIKTHSHRQRFFSLYVARLCTVKTLVGVPTAVALVLLVDRTSGHIFTKCNTELQLVQHWLEIITNLLANKNI